MTAFGFHQVGPDQAGFRLWAERDLLPELGRDRARAVAGRRD